MIVVEIKNTIMSEYVAQCQAALLETICNRLQSEHTRMTGGQIREMLYDAIDML